MWWHCFIFVALVSVVSSFHRPFVPGIRSRPFAVGTKTTPDPWATRREPLHGKDFIDAEKYIDDDDVFGLEDDDFDWSGILDEDDFEDIDPFDEASEDDFSAPLPSKEDCPVNLSEEEIQSLTTNQLKQQLRLRGLKVSGRKQELTDRLYTYFERAERAMREDAPSETTKKTPPPIVDAEFTKSTPGQKSKAEKMCDENGKELTDVTDYLDEDEKGKHFRSSDEEAVDEAIKRDDEYVSAETWGAEARIIDDYEGDSLMVDGLSRIVVEYLGSNSTFVQAYVVANRDALKPFLRGAGLKGNKENMTSAEQRVREIQEKRENATRKYLPEFDIEDGVDEGDEPGYYNNIINRDFSDWGAYSSTGAQVSATEVQGVILLSDVYGAFANDTRALAEKIAFECQPVVVMAPDLFRGDPWEEVENGLNAKGEDYETWRAQHDDTRVNVDIRSAAVCLRQQYGVSSVVVWGTCYGGGRALEAASGYVPGGVVHDIDGSIGPPPVDPMCAIAWYPTRYDVDKLFGRNHKGTKRDGRNKPRNFAVMAVFGGKDELPGATMEDAERLQTLLREDPRVKDEMVKVFPNQDHGFAHIGMYVRDEITPKDDYEEFVDGEFGGAGRLGYDDSEASMAHLLSSSFMETYSRVFLPTVGAPISQNANEEEWNSLIMKEWEDDPNRDVAKEIEDAIDNYEYKPSSTGISFDRESDEGQEKLRDFLIDRYGHLLKGDLAIEDEDDLEMIANKLRAYDKDFSLF